MPPAPIAPRQTQLLPHEIRAAPASIQYFAHRLPARQVEALRSVRTIRTAVRPSGRTTRETACERILAGRMGATRVARTSAARADRVPQGIWVVAVAASRAVVACPQAVVVACPRAVEAGPRAVVVAGPRVVEADPRVVVAGPRAPARAAGGIDKFGLPASRGVR